MLRLSPRCKGKPLRTACSVVTRIISNRDGQLFDIVSDIPAARHGTIIVIMHTPFSCP